MLAARGFPRVEGIYYNQTYAPVVNFTSVRVLLAVVTPLILLLHRRRVVTAFLNSDLEECAYMQQPEDFKAKANEHLVCRPSRSIFGLKQANGCWYKKMNSFVCGVLGLQQNSADRCLYSSEKKGSIVMIVLYVDDLVFACNSPTTLCENKDASDEAFGMKSLNDALQCLI